MADAYIQVEGVKGSSIDHEHKEWIEIRSYAHNLSQPINAEASGSSGRRPKGRAQFEDFVIFKEQDSASPHLAHLCASGNHVKKIEVELLAAGAAGTNKRNKYMKFTLEDVYVSAFISKLADGKERPIEEVHFSFGKVKWTFTPDEKSQSKAPIVKGWDRDTNKDYS